MAAWELGQPTKVGDYDDSVLLDHTWIQVLAPWWKIMKEGPPGDKLFVFSYMELVTAFKEVCSTLGVDAVLYQSRHSGASIDRISGLRTLAEIGKRGRWRSHGTLSRYEKAARLATTWKEFSTPQQAHFLDCERRVGDVFRGRCRPPVPPPTLGMSS